MSRWTRHRTFDDSIPSSHHEAHIFLDNAFRHILGSSHSDALFILTDAMRRVSGLASTKGVAA